MNRRRRVRWWQFWNPQSGFLGGLVGACVMIVFALLVDLLIQAVHA